MLKIYERGEHKAGFIGVRVAVMVDGKQRQKYFSYKNTDKSEVEVYKEAERLHKEWLMLKNLASSKVQRESKELRRVTSPYSTGVKGIKFKINNKRACFFVQGSTNNNLFNKSISINDYGFDLAWYKACEFLQSKKDYSLFDEVYRRKPHKEMLLITFRYLYFIKKKNVHLEAIAGIVEKPIFTTWLKQLALQYKNNKQFKNEILRHMKNNNINDPDLFELI